MSGLGTHLFPARRDSTTGGPDVCVSATPADQRTLMLAALAMVWLSACETIPPPPRIVSVPVAVSCVRSVPARPFVHTDPQLAGFDDYKFTLAIFSDRRNLLDYSAELEAVLSACR